MPPAPELPYTEIAPPADLAPYVDRLWLRTTRAPAPMHRVLPDGCVDVIVDVARGAARADVVGAMTRAIEVPGVPSELIAVRFKPGTAAALTGCGLAELTDASVGVAELGLPGALADQVAGAAAGPGAPRLPAQIPLSALSHARLSALVGWLRQRLADAPPPDPRIARAVALLSSAARRGGPPTAAPAGRGAAPSVGSTGEARVADVADTLGVTRQYLARGFRREVGITPKQLARIARMQRAAAVLRRGSDLARLAAELGYFDQSHLSRELRDLVGVTPAALAAERPIALSHLFGPPPSR